MEKVISNMYIKWPARHSMYIDIYENDKRYIGRDKTIHRKQIQFSDQPPFIYQVVGNDFFVQKDMFESYIQYCAKEIMKQEWSHFWKLSKLKQTIRLNGGIELEFGGRFIANEFIANYLKDCGLIFPKHRSLCWGLTKLYFPNQLVLFIFDPSALGTIGFADNYEEEFFVDCDHETNIEKMLLLNQKSIQVKIEEKPMEGIDSLLEHEYDAPLIENLIHWQFSNDVLNLSNPSLEKLKQNFKPKTLESLASNFIKNSESDGRIPQELFSKNLKILTVNPFYISQFIDTDFLLQ